MLSGLSLAVPCCILRCDMPMGKISNRLILSVLLCAQLVATLRGCSSAICDKVERSGEGAIIAVTDLIEKRGHELQDFDIPGYARKLSIS